MAKCHYQKKKKKKKKKKGGTYAHRELQKETLNISLHRWGVLRIGLRLELCVLGLRNHVLDYEGILEGLGLCRELRLLIHSSPF